jgi:transposase
MKRRKWMGKEKLQIVLEGLRGQVPLGELCARYQLSQSQYYQWRDQLLNHGARVFDRGGPEQTEQRLRAELRHLKTLVGELTVE